MARHCTYDFKLRPIWKWLKEHGATPAAPAVVGIGISVDEMQRAKSSSQPFQQTVHPLLDLGLRRSDCYQIIADAGLPRAPKSSCYFCPFHRPQVWAEMARDEPELFEKAAQLEDSINARKVAAGRDPVFLTRYGRRLRECVAPAQPGLFDDAAAGEFESCDEGVCFV